MTGHAALNDMQLNTSKTKEMILGPLARANLLLLTTITTDLIDRVTSFKLLGIYIDSTLSWTIHVDSMVKKPLAGYTKAQTQKLDAIQKRSIQIVLNFSRGMPYSSMQI